MLHGLTGTGRIMRAVGRKVVIRRTVLGRIIMRTVGLTVLCRARVAYMADMLTELRGDFCRGRRADVGGRVLLLESSKSMDEVNLHGSG